MPDRLTEVRQHQPHVESTSSTELGLMLYCIGAVIDISGDADRQFSVD